MQNVVLAHFVWLTVALSLLAQLLKTRRCDQHNVWLQVAGTQQFQALRMQIEHAYLATRYDCSDCFKRRACKKVREVWR